MLIQEVQFLTQAPTRYIYSEHISPLDHPSSRDPVTQRRGTGRTEKETKDHAQPEVSHYQEGKGGRGEDMDRAGVTYSRERGFSSLRSFLNLLYFIT